MGYITLGGGWGGAWRPWIIYVFPNGSSHQKTPQGCLGALGLYVQGKSSSVFNKNPCTGGVRKLR